MKKAKYIGLALAAILILAIAFERPILWEYYTHNAVEAVVEYPEDLLVDISAAENIDDPECVLYGTFSDEFGVELPGKSDTVTIETKPGKSAVYDLLTCFERDGDYCFVLRGLLRHFPENSKTHRGDILVVLDKDGNEKLRFKSDKKELILDYSDGAVLIFDLKDNEFCYKDAASSEVKKTSAADCEKYEKAVLSRVGDAWQAKFYDGENSVGRKALDN